MVEILDFDFNEYPEKLWSFSLNFPNPVIIFFFANWCSFCKKLRKTIDLINFDGKVNLIEVNVDKFPSIFKSEIFNFNTIPTIFIFKKKKLLFKASDSSITSKEIESLLNS